MEHGRVDPRIKSDRYTPEQIVSVYRGLFIQTGEQSKPLTDRGIRILVKNAEDALDEDIQRIKAGKKPILTYNSSGEAVNG